MPDDAQLVIYRGAVYRVVMPYSHHLALEDGQGTRVDVPYNDPDLIRQPTEADVAALQQSPKKPRR